MKKQLLFLVMSVIWFSGFTQTQNTLPPGSKSYGNQLYLDPDGKIWGGTGSAKFRVVDTKERVDSLMALKVTSVSGKTGVVALNKMDVGLGAVDNTADLLKPISTATANKLDLKVEKVANIAALKEMKGMVNGQVVEVIGYNNFDDLGGGPFTYIAGITHQDDGGYIIAPTGAASGRWVRLFKDNTINVKQFGMLDNGVGDMTSIFNSIKAFSGGKRTIFFPQNQRLSGAIYSFLTPPDFSNCVIATEPDVLLVVPTTNSTSYKNCKFLTNVLIRSSDRNNTTLSVKNYDIPDYLAAISNGDITGDHGIDNIKVLDANSGIRKAYNLQTGTISAGSSSIVASDEVYWPKDVVGGNSTGLLDAVMFPSKVGKEFSSSFYTDATSTVTGVRVGIVVESEGEFAFLSIRNDNLSELSVKKQGQPSTIFGLLEASASLLPSLAYSANYDSNPSISIRVTDLNKVEFYVNGGYAGSYTSGKSINYVGFGINGTYNSLGNATFKNLTAHDSKTRSNGSALKIRVHGNSITFGEGSTLSWPQMLNQALRSISGISDVVVDNRGVSGETSTQILNRLNNGGSLSSFNYVICMAGTNDIQRLVPISTFEANINAMITKIKNDGSVPILVVPPMYIDQISTGYGYTTENYKRGGVYRTSIMKVCAQRGVECVDLVSDFGKIGPQNKQLRDNIHPHSFYYSFIAKAVAQKVLKLYKPKDITIETNLTHRVGENLVSYSTSAPDTGYWNKGDIWHNINPSENEPLMGVCLDPGTPGVWKYIYSEPLLKSPDGTKFKLTVSNDGNVQTSIIN